MDSEILGFAHVKLPVTDVERSARWYASLLGMALCMEFVEEGQLRGVELVHQASGMKIALRDRAYCTGQPTLTGFDAVAVELSSVDAVHAMADRCAADGVRILGILDFADGAAMDVPDPDGTVVRIHHAVGRPAFLGVESGEYYTSPRLTGVPVAQ